MKLFLKKSTLFLLLTCTGIMLLLMLYTGSSLHTPETPAGILNLEFAYTGKKGNQVLDNWKKYADSKADIITAAKNNTYLDFIFLLFYSLFLFTCCRQLAHSLLHQELFKKIFFIASACALITGLLDIIENIGMLISLHRTGSDTVAMVTTISAVIKWMLVLLIIVCIACGIIYRYGFFRKQIGYN